MVRSPDTSAEPREVYTPAPRSVGSNLRLELYFESALPSPWVSGNASASRLPSRYLPLLALSPPYPHVTTTGDRPEAIPG